MKKYQTSQKKHRGFDPRPGHFFQRIDTSQESFLTLLSSVSTMCMYENKSVAWEENCAGYKLKELDKSMDVCIGKPDLTENGVKHDKWNRCM